MTAQIETSWVYKYKDDIEHELQQKMAKFRGAISEQACSGEGLRPVMRVGPATVSERTTRFQTMTPQELALTARWVEPTTYKVDPILEDNIDKVRNGVEFTSSYAQAAAQGINRQIDDLIIAAMYATAKTGKNGSDTTTAVFDTTNMRVATGSVGLTVAKLREMQRRFLEQEVDLDAEMPWCAISPKQNDNLLADIQVTSRDFNGGTPTLKEGRIDSFMGFKFLISNRLPTSSASTRRCFCWVPSGMMLGMWANMNTSITTRNDLEGLPTQVYAEIQMGATRLHEYKVGEILCSE